MVGGRVSRTMTLKEQLAVPELFDAVQVTAVDPRGKLLPDGGVQITVGLGFPLAAGN